MLCCQKCRAIPPPVSPQGGARVAACQTRHRQLLRGLVLAIVASICVVGVGRAQERGTITVTARVLSRDSTLRRLVRRAASRSAETGTVGATSARYAQSRETDPAWWSTGA